MDPDVRCPRKAIKLNYSLTHWLSNRTMATYDLMQAPRVLSKSPWIFQHEHWKGLQKNQHACPLLTCWSYIFLVLIHWCVNTKGACYRTMVCQLLQLAGFDMSKKSCRLPDCCFFNEKKKENNAKIHLANWQFQPGTKPNSVAKILATISGDCFVHGLPKLVANISSQFNIWLTQCWLLVLWSNVYQLKSPTPPKLMKFEWFVAHLIVIAFNTRMHSGILHQMMWGSLLNSLVLLLVCALEVNFLEKLTQLAALSIFQSSYFSLGESLTLNYKYFITLLLDPYQT